MKKIVCFIILLLISIQAQAQVNFETSLTKAFEKAKLEKKIVFIDYYNSECTVCKELSKLLATDTIVSNYYNTNFINYKLDTKGDLEGNLKEDEKKLMDKSGLTFDHVPVLLFFDFDGNFLHHSDVKVEPTVVLNIGISAQNPNYRSTSNIKKYNEGDRSIRTLYAYSNYLVATSNDSLLKKVTKDLYDVYSKDTSKMTSNSSYVILKNVINSSENGFFIYWINNLYSITNFDEGYEKDQVQSILKDILLKELINPDRITWSNKKKDLFKEYIIKLKMTDNPDAFFE